MEGVNVGNPIASAGANDLVHTNQFARWSNWTVVHDFAFTYGGAERVTCDIQRAIGSRNPIRYLAGNPAVMNALSEHHAPVLDLPLNERTYRLIAPLYGDILKRQSPIDGNIVASSYSFAHHVRVSGTKVVYCHTPFRQAWSGQRDYSVGGDLAARLATRVFGARWRRQDRSVARRNPHFIATSRAVAARIQDYYGFSALAIVAPAYADEIYTVDSESQRSDAYLWVGRIVEPYKRLSLLIEYFKRNPRKTLLVAGDGRDRRKLERHASKNVKFLGWQNEEELAALYRSTNALIFPSEDDFGITALEAMACGLPVVAYGAGGALDTVVEGESGVFFPDPTVESLHAAIQKFESVTWHNIAIAKSIVEKFGRRRFDVEIREVLESLDVRG